MRNHRSSTVAFWTDPIASNPLKPDRSRDDKLKLGQCDRRRISANFSYPEESISFNSFDLMSNTKIGRYDKKHEHKFV